MGELKEKGKRIDTRRFAQRLQRKRESGRPFNETENMTEREGAMYGELLAGDINIPGEKIFGQDAGGIFCFLFFV